MIIMPLWVHAHRGVGASGRRHGQEWWGPYADARLVNIKAFARIGSQSGTPRDVVYEPAGCVAPGRLRLPTKALVMVGQCAAARLRTYRGGQREFPVAMTPELRDRERGMIVTHRHRLRLSHLQGT